MFLFMPSGLSDPYGARDHQQRGFGPARDADRPRSLYATASANYVNMQPNYPPFGRPPAPLPAEASAPLPGGATASSLSPPPNWQPPSWTSDPPPDDEETHYASQLRSSMAALLHGGHIRQSSTASNASSTFSSYSDEFRSPTAELGLPPAAPFPDYPGFQGTASPPPPPPPVRDASSLKYVKYGPGHEKYPSWPVPHQANHLSAPPPGGSQRSKSWTEHTDYPKEPPATYARPSARPSGYSQQLKTVMENCERILPEVYHASASTGDLSAPSYGLPAYDCDGRNVEDKDYNIPSPPERDVPADYAKYEDIQQYSHSEGYSSYVPSESSYVSVSGTPLLDQLRRDGDSAPPVEAAGLRDSISTAVSSSNSSNETLRWHGSYSDISVTSSAASSGRHLSHPAESAAHVVHSAKVSPPQRHNSESVLYYEQQQQQSTGNFKTINRMGGWNQRVIERKNQWNAQSSKQPTVAEETSVETPAPLSVAERIHQLEWQSKSVPNLAQQKATPKSESPTSPTPQAEKYTFLDPDKRMKVADPTLKAIQKQALLSYYERHKAANGNSNSPPKCSPPPPALPRTSSQSFQKVYSNHFFMALLNIRGKVVD